MPCSGSFVLAHFTKVETALFDIARVLHLDGRVGFTTWADGVDAYQQTWLELVESVVPREMLAPAYAEAAPWHERFKRRDAVEETLIEGRIPDRAHRGREVPVDSTRSTTTSTACRSGRPGGSSGTCSASRVGPRSGSAHARRSPNDSRIR